MSTMQPIRKKEDITRLKNYFLDKGQIRNYVMIVIGLNVPIRISDILKLKWNDVYNSKQDSYYKHLKIEEKKTGKMNILALNDTVLDALELLKKDLAYFQENQYIFSASAHMDKPLNRVSAYLIIKHAADDLGFENIGCHSLRKTFGYHAWKNGVHLAVIMSIYNHTSIMVTKRYLGIEQEDKDEVFHMLQL